MSEEIKTITIKSKPFLPKGVEKLGEEKDKEIERLNKIIDEMEQFFIDNANDEMKKCFDKLHSLKGSDN